MKKISFNIRDIDGDRLRIARTATTMPSDTDELLRIVHALARSRSAVFTKTEGFTYTFGDFRLGADLPAVCPADAFPYILE